jgi:rod shape determining protein RodA
MTVGIMPVTGIPLPFISYGGSSLVTCLASVGVLLNIHLQRTRMTFD